MKSLAVCVLLALLALPAAGLEPYLVKDIESESAPAGSDPSRPVAFGGAVLFFASDGLAGHELWRSDGTAAGTWQLSHALSGELSDPRPFLVTERLYFFLGTNPLTFDASLWVSDGTPAGTFRLTERGVGVRGEGLWVAREGVLYFAAWDLEHGVELWRTDGTPAGTWLVADVRPGAEGSEVQWLTEHRGRVWFGADDGERGGALWRTDGTAAGTVLAVDPVPSSASHGSPEHVRVLGSRLTFSAPPPGAGRKRQLWAGDGTPRGTAPVTALSGGKGGRASIYDSVVHGNRLYFVAEDRKGQELWVSDGTARGTRAVTGFPKPDAFHGIFTKFSVDLPRQQGLRGRFVFYADDGPHGIEPWVTDGTPQGTRLLRDVCPGACSSDPYLGPMFAGRLSFTAYGDQGREIWATDGTPAGTRLLVDVCPVDCDSHPYPLLAVGGRLVFTAGDPQNGRELWSSDGTAAGTVRLSDFEPDYPWYDFHGAVLGGQLLFGAPAGQLGMELWSTDGTAAGTRLVADIQRADLGGSFPRSLRRLGDEVVFVVGPYDAPELWRSDGTAAGTTRFRTFGPGDRDGEITHVGAFAEAGGLLFYFSYGVLWRTDGTEAGTFRLTDSNPSFCCTQEVEAVGSTVFFAQHESRGNELWASDGTVAGTRPVLDILSGADSSNPMGLTDLQGRLLFSANAPNSPGIGRELWTSDGTADGTVPVADINPGADGSAPDHLTVHAGRLWFFADDGVHGRELWSSDGTEGGTRLEADLLPGQPSYQILLMVSLGDRLVFSAFGGGLWASDGTLAGTRKIHDQEIDYFNAPVVWTVFQGRLYYVARGVLWVTDGTEAGTGPFPDRDGNPILVPEKFAIPGNRLLFTAQDLFGLTLWESDGTPAGTFPVQPPVRLNSPKELVGAGGRVFFPGYDRATGWELWAVEE